ncbi:MAG: BTAD domain-containing putative transcriptional regulator [Saprospiraceae bacterium]
MHPQKLALIGSNSCIEHHIRRQIPLTWECSTLKDIGELSQDKFLVALICHHPPLTNGLELFIKVKQAFPGLPILVTGPAPPANDIAEIFRMGALDYLFFPFPSEELANSLQKITEEAQSKPAHWWGKMPSWLGWCKTSFITRPNHSLAVLKFSGSPFLTKQETTSEAISIDIQAQLLGPLTVLVKGQSLPLSGKKAKSLLAFLLDRYPKPVYRDLLIEHFWKDAQPDSARNCLNVHIHTLRRAFATIAPDMEVITFENECYSINPALLVERDIDCFQAYWENGRRIEQESGIEAAVDKYYQAFAYYRGDFLEDLGYEEWTTWERERYKEEWLVILNRLSAHFFKKGKYSICLKLCQEALVRDSALEETHRRLMACYHQLGMRDKAIRQFQKCRDHLKEELSVQPGRETTNLYEQILTG